MTNSVDNTTKPQSKHDENGKKWLNEKNGFKLRNKTLLVATKSKFN